MADVLENVQDQQHEVQAASPLSPPLQPPEGFMQKFRLYETRSKFYMVGRDKNRTYWKILKIDRLEPSELNIREDSTTYTERECSDLLRRIHEGNRATGGLKFVTTCYGIVGFIKFLGPYYMLLITKRRQIGAICGQNVYAISKTEIIPLPNPAVRSTMINYKNENRYKKLLCTVDLTKDFYFSYSYNVMRSLQKNMCDRETGQVLYETMFVWNEFLTRGIRNILQNTIWTVALVYGFFKQATVSISGRDLKLTLIARRSGIMLPKYLDRRYLKRGVNEKGRVANDVETEQILAEDVPEGLPMQISSVVQNRGSIPLFWSQETSRLNLKPDIICFILKNLVKRYGNPIIILNLIKTNEKKPRESILRAEFANAIEVINKDLSEENRLKFLHWDLHKHSRSKATNVLLLLERNFVAPGTYSHTDTEKHNEDENEDSDNSDRKSSGGNSMGNSNPSARPPMVQKGVLRTNCIDCLDRTNVAQYAYGLAALGHQLRALGVTTSTKLELDDPLAEELMGFYERMGDTLAHQYGGSAAHNKIFSQRRGQWKAATQSQEFFRTLQRYYSNAYMDAEKQNAINVFLGHFQPQPDKPDVWELDSDQHYNVGRNGEPNIDKDGRYSYGDCFTYARILHDLACHFSEDHGQMGTFFVKVARTRLRQISIKVFLVRISPMIQEESKCFLSQHRNVYSHKRVSLFKVLVWSNMGVFASSRSGDLRYTSSMPARELFAENNKETLNMKWGSSCDIHIHCLLSWSYTAEERIKKWTLLTVSPTAMLSSENVVNELVGETTPSTSECGSSMREMENTGTDICYGEIRNYEVLEDFSDSFVRWRSDVSSREIWSRRRKANVPAFWSESHVGCRPPILPCDLQQFDRGNLGRTLIT
ncbi:Phosphoinositide phosphatase SAC4 [Sesamum angolense]|uniref:Phosphoinositide phosphatase SAC4 n=1 Tax=Sesamum angolense TaxID=2727404 RepID=A0AAE2BTA3_9LAMI|nr:Phosphoinositide phosphatase SAC4 [Sesamum angolense]